MTARIFKRPAGIAGPLLAAAFFLAACASPITSGTVESRQDIPGHLAVIEQPHYRTQCTEEEEETGKTEEEEEDCTQVLAYYLPYTYWVPERWELLVKGSNRTGWVSVTEAVYDSARAGAHWQAAGS